MNTIPFLCLAGLLVLAFPTPCRAADGFVQSPEDRARIEQAAPREPVVKPAQPRRLLIFTRNVGYGGHPSIAYANQAFSVMGKKTGAFDTVVTDDPAVFERDRLKGFDAVFFNNTVGNCFTNADLRRNLLEFVTGGGGLMGVHGTTVAFTQWPGAVEDWPEFGFLIGGRGANHKDSDEHVWMKLDDALNPILRAFGGQTFDYRDEFFRVHDPYSRDRVRVLFSIDTAKTDVNAGQPRGNCFRKDNDYGLAWIRSYGRGRVFYCTIAHNPYVFYDPRMLQFYLAAAQFALGDLPVPTTPSAKLTPAIKAQENLGWQLAAGSPNLPLLESIDQTARLGIPFLTASSTQMVSTALTKPFGPQLSDQELDDLRLQLEHSGLRLLTWTCAAFPADEAGCRKLFEFGRKMGIECLIGQPTPSQLPLIEKLADEYRSPFAIRMGADKGSPYANPAALEKLCHGRSPRLGACGDLETWLRSGLKPAKVVRALGDRLRVLELGQAAPGQFAPLLAELKRVGTRSFIFSLDAPAPTSQIEAFNSAVLKLETQ